MILITGASDRLGLEIATALAADRVPLLLHSRRSEPELRPTIDRLLALGAPGVTTVSGDFLDEGALERVATDIAARAPHLQAAVFNAATYPQRYLDEESLSSITQTFQINTFAPALLLAKLAKLPRFNKALFITDSRAIGAWKSRAGYLASKAALESLIKSAAIELAPKVVVAGVAPGPVELPGDDDALKARILARLPTQRLVQVDEIVSLIQLLLKPDFRANSGNIWRIDGARNLDN